MEVDLNSPVARIELDGILRPTVHGSADVVTRHKYGYWLRNALNLCWPKE